MKILSKEFGNWSVVCDHLLHSNFLSSVENVSVLAHENKKYLLEIKERLLIIANQALRYKIWGTYRCVSSYWKEGQTIK